MVQSPATARGMRPARATRSLRYAVFVHSPAGDPSRYFHFRRARIDPRVDVPAARLSPGSPSAPRVQGSCSQEETPRGRRIRESPPPRDRLIRAAWSYGAAQSMDHRRPLTTRSVVDRRPLLRLPPMLSPDGPSHGPQAVRRAPRVQLRARFEVGPRVPSSTEKPSAVPPWNPLSRHIPRPQLVVVFIDDPPHST